MPVVQLQFLLHFYETGAAYSYFHSLFYSASGRMRNLSFRMNFENEIRQR